VKKRKKNVCIINESVKVRESVSESTARQRGKGGEMRGGGDAEPPGASVGLQREEPAASIQ